MRNQTLMLFLLGTLLSMFCFQACEESLAEDVRTNVSVTSEILLGQAVYHHACLLVDEAARDSLLLASGTALIGGALVTAGPTDYSFLISFGDSNIMCTDGLVRRGSMRADFPTGYLGDSLFLIIRFQDYYVDDKRVEGELSITSGSLAFDNPWNVRMQIDNGKLGEVPEIANWNADITWSWFKGMNTPFDILDDSVMILSDSRYYGRSVSGIDWNANAKEPLSMGRPCPWISSGVLSLDMPALFIRFGSVTYGRGECDARVDLYFNGETISFFLD